MIKIIVNATAPTDGGSLIILEDFLKSIKFSRQFEYIVFTSICKLNFMVADNIKIINPNAKSWLRRMYWDFYGLNKWLKMHEVTPGLIVSLQSNGVKVDKSIQQVVYYHQPVPINEYKWSLFDRRQRILWIKKHLLGFIIAFYNNKNFEFIVQLQSVAKQLSRRFLIEASRIHLFYPSIPFDIINNKAVYNNSNNSNPFIIFYPASSMIYKNHMEIVNALFYIKQYNPALLDTIKVVFSSVTANDLPEVFFKIRELGLENNFESLGYVSRQLVLQYYAESDLMLFPSYIETFGLPLVEAAAFGLPIGVADVEYSREVLQHYSGVTYLNIGNTKEWAEFILLNYNNRVKHKALNYKIFQPSWGELIEFLELKAAND